MKIVMPLTLQHFLFALVPAADAIMLVNLEQDAMSAVSLATQVSFVLNLFTFAVTQRFQRYGFFTVINHLHFSKIPAMIVRIGIFAKCSSAYFEFKYALLQIGLLLFNKQQTVRFFELLSIYKITLMCYNKLYLYATILNS